MHSDKSVCGTCSSKAEECSSQQQHQEVPKPERREGIEHYIAVMSGKGGVGKSLVTGLLATSLAKKGFNVGILDADVTGPSIPKMFGLKEKVFSVGSNLLPPETSQGIKVMSLNLLLASEEMPVIWRGPIIAKAIQQFWEEVLWGKLDYLLVDLPPGTADAVITVMQCIPLDGVVIVASPQGLAMMIVKKAIHMAKDVNVPVLGLIENMSYAVCPKCGEKLEFFGKSQAEKVADDMDINLLGKLPIDSRIARLCDEGKIEKYSNGSFEKVAKTILDLANRKSSRSSVKATKEKRTRN